MQSAIDLAFAFARRLCIEKAVRSTGSKLMRGTYSQDIMNDGIFVVAEIFALLANLAIGRQSTQSF